MTKTQEPRIEDLSDVFTKAGIQKLKKGQLLRFDYEGSLNEFIITKLNKKSGLVLAKPVRTFRSDQVTIDDQYGTIETFDEFVKGKE